MDLYQVGSYDAPGVKTGPALESHMLEHRNKEGKLGTGTCRALIFGIKHCLVDLYQVCSYDAPEVKTGPALGAQVGT